MRIRDSLQIRRAGIKDVSAITSFSAAMALETEGRYLDLKRLHDGTVALLEASSNGVFMVAELTQADSPQLVGQLLITYEWSDWRNGIFWWVQSVYIDPAWRRQGILRQMYNFVLAMAKTHANVCGVRLYVEENNHVAQAVYRSVGLAPTSYVVFETDFTLEKIAPK